jgi:hypothetical protein
MSLSLTPQRNKCNPDRPLLSKKTPLHTKTMQTTTPTITKSHTSLHQTHHNPTTVITKQEPDNPPHTTPDTTTQSHIPTIEQLIDALPKNDTYIKKLIQQLPDQWSGTNATGTPITKKQLIQGSWGELKETDSLQSFQQAIIASFPPPTTNVTQYHAQLTSAICRGSSVWQHTIYNACQDKNIPHPLFHPITIFNIHHNSHFTTLITNNQTYYYYDPLNLHPPQATGSTPPYANGTRNQQ